MNRSHVFVKIVLRTEFPITDVALKGFDPLVDHSNVLIKVTLKSEFFVAINALKTCLFLLDFHCSRPLKIT